MAIIPVSFKRTEMDLYELVLNEGDRSNFMKDALKFYLKHNGKKENTPVETEVSSSEIEDILGL